jgi:hypothetical protein
VKRIGLFLFVMMSAVFANAGISEIKVDFLNQTTALVPAAIFAAGAAGSADGSYLVCIYLEQANPGTMTATLAWTDENDRKQSTSPANNTGAVANYATGCTLIRNRGGTAATIAVDGAPFEEYSVHVAGFGFWPNQPQKQGGVTEPIAQTFSGDADLPATVLLSTSAGGTYLISLFTQYLDGLTHGGTATLRWTDDEGAQSRTTWFCVHSPCFTFGSEEISQPDHYAFLIHAAPHTAIMVETAETTNKYLLQVNAVEFGEPASGAGPLTDYEYDFLDWTNATFPGLKTVVPCSAPLGIYLTSAHLAEVNLEAPSMYTTSDVWIVATSNGTPGKSWDPQMTVPISPTCNNGMDLIGVGTANGVEPVYGASPTYSAEVDVVRF